MSKKARIVSGDLRGRFFEIISTPKTRPTLERVKEAIFQMIHVEDDYKVLDIFGGTGALGIEMLSKGCEFVQYIEKNPQNASLIRKNLKSLEIENDKYKIGVGDFKIQLKRLKGKKFDVVLVDPPFDRVRYYSDALIMLMKEELIKDGSIIMVEKRKTNTIDIPEEYETLKHKFYGDSEVFILEYRK